MKRIWIFIHTHRGLIQAPEIFYSKSKALLRQEEILQKNFNRDYDEVEVFEKIVKIKA